jgi:hypothetical protein
MLESLCCGLLAKGFACRLLTIRAFLAHPNGGENVLVGTLPGGGNYA